VPDYVFEVTADDAGGTSPLSAPSAPIVTLTDPSVTPPDAPIFGAGSSTVMLSNGASLTDPTPPLDSNGMVFNVGDNEVSDSGTDDQPVGAYLLLQQPNHTYGIEARAYNAGGYSAWSSPETFVTPSFSPDPPVSDLAATAVSSTEIDLSWTPPPVENAGGPLIYESTDGTSWTPLLTSSNSGTFAVTGLTPGTEYRFAMDTSEVIPAGPTSAPTETAWLDTDSNTATAVTQSSSTSDDTVSVSAPLPNATFSGPDTKPQDGYLEFSRTGDDTSGLTANGKLLR